MKEILYKVVLIVCGVILLAGIVLTAIFIQDDTTVLLLALTFALYLVYLFVYAKRAKRKQEKKPLQNRKR